MKPCSVYIVVSCLYILIHCALEHTAVVWSGSLYYFTSLVRLLTAGFKYAAAAVHHMHQTQRKLRQLSEKKSCFPRELNPGHQAASLQACAATPSKQPPKCCVRRRFLLQLPSFNELSMVSLVGALMSISYCTIAVAMSGTVRNPPGSINYDPALVPRAPLDRIMGIFNALTSILFAYGELQSSTFGFTYLKAVLE